MSNFSFLGSFLGKTIRPSKDGHDMSNKETMTFPFGTIVPKKKLDVVPNEHYKINTGTYVQTRNMREDNFQEIYLNQKAVYVPYDALIRDYLSLTSSQRSTLKDVTIPEAAYPTISLDALLKPCIAMFVLSRWMQEIIAIIPDWQHASLYMYEDDGEQLVKFVDSNDEEIQVDSSNPFISYALDASSMFGSTFSDSTSFTLVDMFERLNSFLTPSGSLWCYDCLRILDSLDYGNFFPLAEKFVTHLSYRDTFSFYPFYWDANNSDWNLNITSISIVSRKVSALPLFALQYVYSYFFKSNYRHPNLGLLSVDAVTKYTKSSDYSYAMLTPGNLDLIYDANAVGFSWSGDIFDSLYGMTESFYGHGFEEIISRLSTEPELNFWMYYFLTSLANPLLDSDVFTTSQLSVVSGNIPTVNTADFNANPVQKIADVSALYKLRQDLLRAGVRRDKQMQVMFGISDHDESIVQKVYMLDSSKSSVNIQSLINQAETDVAPLGVRASKGNGSCSLNFEFDTEDFGIIIFLDYYTCPLFYENFMLNRSNVLSPSAWFNPRYNYLGLEALYSSELSIFTANSPIVSELSEVNNPSVVGYSVRDAYLKQKVNVVHGYFTNVGMPIYDNGKMVDLPYSLKNNQRGSAAFGGYVATVCDSQLKMYRYAPTLYFNPYMLNGIFTLQYDGVVHGSPEFDNFITITNYNIHKVSPFPKLGLIKLD